jgi:hypothetical protein
VTILCDFVYAAPSEPGERYTATCLLCGRVVKTKTTKAVATCRTSPKRPRPQELMQMAGVSMSKPPIVGGPGTELKKLLKEWLGIEATPTCRCNTMAARMDALGVGWCESEAGMAEILGVMREEHGRRRLAGETILPWTDFGATQLVRLACRRGRTT